MRKEWILPTILIALDVGAALMYIGKWHKVSYWMAAAMITASVTYFEG